MSAIVNRFPLGSYIQIDDEIMRIVSSTLGGTFSDEITVIRGALATRQTDHDNGSIIKKIKPLPVEFRRPSIARASGHTFEYLGYGPGNYSTGLPQVQVKTLTEREDFLSQSQERSAGVVVYTGMNSKGDSFVGNQKKSSATGEEITFDTPIPTITGVDPSRLSVVFDEATIKERLVVEGGNSNTVLSQFDGPVTFNREVKINDQVTLTKPANSNASFTLKVNDEEQSTSATTGAVIIKGGVGIAKNLNVGGTTTFTGLVDMNTSLDVDNLRLDGNVLSSTNTNGDITLTPNGSGNVVLSSDLRINGNDIQASDGNTNITLTSNTLTTFAGDLKINGNDIQASDGSTAITLSGTTVTVPGTLNVNGNTTLGDSDSDVTKVNGELRVSQDIIAYYTSDQRLKDNITPIPNALGKVLSISGNTFDWNEESGKKGTEAGVIAQEVLEVLPEVVTTRDNGYLAVHYDKIVPLLIEAVKELSRKVDELQQKLNDK